MRTLFKNGTVVTATEAVEADVLVEDELVVLIGLSLEAEADRRPLVRGVVLQVGVELFVSLVDLWGETDDQDLLFIELISPPEGTLPSLIQKMVQECCSGELGPTLNVVDAWKRYQAPLEQILREV